MGAQVITITSGKGGVGKTTAVANLAVALAAEYVRRGKRVMTIKHASHPAAVDTPGTDSYRHFHEGRAERVLPTGGQSWRGSAERADRVLPTWGQGRGGAAEWAGRVGGA